jgi:2-oxoglutarate ferredoxin oxidoreductase subunit alpha
MRNLSDPKVMHDFVTRPIRKIIKHRDHIVQTEEAYAGAEIVLVSYGTVSRAARAAAHLARKQGLSVGTLRLVTCWPLPDSEIRKAAAEVEAMLVLENNTGQLYPYIKAEAAGACRVSFLGPEILGQVHAPEHILAHIKGLMP